MGSSSGSKIPTHWVTEIFKRFRARYGHKWTSAIAGIEGVAVSEWARALEGVDGAGIARGMVAWREDWPPSANEFARACKPDSGAPDAAEAWRIVCNARGALGSLEDRYRHPVVLAAASCGDCDTYAWSMLRERDGLARFRQVYQRYLDRLESGEPFSWPHEAQQIDDMSGKAVTPEEREESARKAAEELKKARVSVSCLG